MAITKELAIASIIITPATGAVRVEQVQRVLEDGHELASTPGPTVQLQPGDALDGLPPAVQASIAALWGQDWVQAHTRKALDELAADLPAQDTTTPRTPSVLERAGGTKGK